MPWELHVKRLGEHSHGGRTRTYGAYQVMQDGAPVEGLSGWMIEPHGPGDNGPSGRTHKRRIAPGAYPLTLHRGGKYRTVGFKAASSGATATPLPGIGVIDTGHRSAILIHCTHDPFDPGSPYDRWLSSVGCFNPTRPLGSADEKMNFDDSHARTVALIDSLKAFARDRFPSAAQAIIPGATLVVTDA